MTQCFLTHFSTHFTRTRQNVVTIWANLSHTYVPLSVSHQAVVICHISHCPRGGGDALGLVQPVR